MHLRLRTFIAILALFAAYWGLGRTNRAQAQASILPDGWCQQPSDTRLFANDRYSQFIGNSEGGIRAVYQPHNNRIILQRTDPRELVQVVEENVMLHEFLVVRYSHNCRYLIAIIRDTTLQYFVVVYDLLTETPTRLGGIPNIGRNSENIESSPEGNYLLVTTWDGLHLWNLSSNTRTHLTALARTDCDFVGLVGCSGERDTYREARWDVPNGLLQLDLISNYTLTLNLPAATVNRVEATPRNSDHYPVVSPDELASVAAAFTSNYACMPRVQYQTYNRRVVLLERYAHQLVAVVEPNLDLSGFQFLGWSTTCNYIVAAVEDENGLRLAAWNVNDMSRREHPLTDWVDRYSWATAGGTIWVTTDGGQFEWSLSQS